jgi:hypothetical protein
MIIQYIFVKYEGHWWVESLIILNEDQTRYENDTAL